MMFWTREVAGWALVLFSLILIRLGLSYITALESPKIVEAGVIMFAAMAVLRAGILLIRISTAARICRGDRESDRS